jgi:YHS domain-containing protein
VIRKAISSIVFILVLLSFTAIYAGEKAECPVCGFIVNPKEALSNEHEGTTYYFCNAGCKAYFLQNPEEMTSGKTYDPVCGMVFDKDKGVRAEHDGRAVYFCAEECKGKYFADPAKYEINYDVVAEKVMPESQMKHKVEFEGQTYYFVSDESRGKFEANPAAYIYEACPIGGDVFLRKDAAGAREYKGKTYYFGCKGCLDKFDEDADKYMSQKGTLKCQKSCKDKGAHEGCPLKKKSSS